MKLDLSEGYAYMTLVRYRHKWLRPQMTHRQYILEMLMLHVNERGFASFSSVPVRR